MLGQGFGASLLADDVIDYFPEAENITVAVDSSLLLGIFSCSPDTMAFKSTSNKSPFSSATVLSPFFLRLKILLLLWIVPYCCMTGGRNVP